MWPPHSYTDEEEAATKRCSHIFRVETNIFVFVLSRKFSLQFSFSRKFSHQFSRKLKQIFAKTKIEAKTFAKTKIFAKRNFAKITSFSHDFRFSRKWKNRFRFNPTYIALYTFVSTSIKKEFFFMLWQKILPGNKITEGGYLQADSLQLATFHFKEIPLK
jgi:hypothetical protein